MRQFHWRLTAILFCAAALNYADRSCISAVLPLLRRDLALTDVALGGLGTAFLWAYAAGSPFAGVIADRWPRGKVLLISLLGWSVITTLTAFSQNYWQLIATRVILGLAECLYLPAATALLADYHPNETRGTAMGLHSAGLNLGLVAGGVLAGYLGEHYGWRFSFLVLGGIGGLLAATVWQPLMNPPPRARSNAEARRDAPRRAAPVARDLKYLLGIPSFLILVSKSAMLSVGIWIFFNWLPLYFNETYKMSLAASGFTGTFTLQVAATAGVLMGGFFSDRVARESPRNRMLLQGACYLFSAPFLMAFLGQPALWLVSTCILGFALARGMGQANENPLICEVVPQSMRSTALGVVNLMNSLTGGMGVLFAGILKREFTLGGVFAATAVLMVASAALLFIGFRYFLAADLQRRRQWEHG